MNPNTFNLTLPTSTLPGANGVMAANFDFGPNTNTIAQSAYSFLNTSFANGQNFFSHGVQTTNKFVGGFLNPLVGAAASNVNQNAALLPTLMANEQALAGQAMQDSTSVIMRSIGAQQQVQNASINVSKKAAGSGGGCFITTAVCTGLDLPDDCEILTKLRAFRDSYLQSTSTGRSLIAVYYGIAPGIVADMEKAPEKVRKVFYARLLSGYLVPAVSAIDEGQPIRATRIYLRMVAYASRIAHEFRS